MSREAQAKNPYDLYDTLTRLFHVIEKDPRWHGPDAPPPQESRFVFLHVLIQRMVNHGCIKKPEDAPYIGDLLMYWDGRFDALSYTEIHRFVKFWRSLKRKAPLGEDVDKDGT